MNKQDWIDHYQSIEDREAEALALYDEKILAFGSYDEIKRLYDAVCAANPSGAYSIKSLRQKDGSYLYELRLETYE